MPDAFIILLLIIALALLFDFANGLNDAANAIATVVSTRVLSPIQAVLMAATLNFVGALSGTAVAKMVGSGLVEASAVTQGTLIGALISAAGWVIIASRMGLPVSGSHSLLASLVGAAIATAGPGALIWSGVQKVIFALVISPIIGFGVGFLLMIMLLRGFVRSTPATVSNLFRPLQILSAAFMAFSHGSNDAQKTMGVITLALASYYQWTEFRVPIWVMLLAAVIMGIGTAVGGWRVVRTLGVRITKLQPIHGFAAATSAGAVILSASQFGIPVSTTHVISSTIMGVGASRRVSAVRWGIAGELAMGWFLTLPGCALAAWGLTYLTEAIF